MSAESKKGNNGSGYFNSNRNDIDKKGNIKSVAGVFIRGVLLSAAIVWIASPTTMPKLSAVKEKYADMSLTGKTAVVVGATAGIGKAIAQRLAKADCSVTVVGRSETRGNALVEEMNELSPTAKHQFARCDAMLLGNVKELTGKWVDAGRPLDYLVMTQGMATFQGRTETPEGIDQKLALHFFSRAAFAQQLLPLLNLAENPRVLSVLSGGVHSAYANYEDDFELKNYGLKLAADCAGFYNDAYLDKMSEAHPKITFIHAAPGFVKTSWGTELPSVVRWAVRGIQVFGRSPDTCGEFMASSLYNPDFSGFVVMNQNGDVSKTTKMHNEAKDAIFEKTNALLARVMVDQQASS